MNLLDTSALIELICGTPKGAKIRTLINDKPVATSSFTLYELQMGLKTQDLTRINSLFKEIKVFEFESKAALKSAEIEKRLKSKGDMINKVDIFIAGICLVNNCILVTCDEDFGRIEGLKSEFY